MKTRDNNHAYGMSSFAIDKEIIAMIGVNPMHENIDVAASHLSYKQCVLISH